MMAIPEFTYTKDVPQGTQKQSVTQAPIQRNFQAIKELVEIDHEGFNLVNNVGKHKRVSLLTHAPAPTFDANDAGLYNFLNPTTTKNELYVHKQTVAGTSNIPFTASYLSNNIPANNAAGWTYLPSGILMRWTGVTGTGLTTVTLLPASTPAFSNIFIVFPIMSTPTGDANAAVSFVDIISNTQFRVYFSKRTTTGAAPGEANVLIIGR